jgi:hypothetical protein
MKGDLELIPALLVELMFFLIVIMVAIFINNVELNQNLGVEVVEENREYRSIASTAALRNDRRLLNETNEQDLHLDILQNRELEHGENQNPENQFSLIWEEPINDRSLGTEDVNNEPEMRWDLTEHKKRIFQFEFRPMDVSSEREWDDGIDEFVNIPRNYTAGKVEFSLNNEKVGQMEWTNLGERENSNYSLSGDPEEGPVDFSTSSSLPMINIGKVWQFRLNMKNNTVSVKPENGKRIEKRFDSYESFDEFSVNLSRKEGAEYSRIDFNEAFIFNRINTTRTENMLEENFAAYEFEIQEVEDSRKTVKQLSSEEERPLTFTEVLVARPSKNPHRLVLGTSGKD